MGPDTCLQRLKTRPALRQLALLLPVVFVKIAQDQGTEYPADAQGSDQQFLQGDVDQHFHRQQPDGAQADNQRHQHDHTPGHQAGQAMTHATQPPLEQTDQRSSHQADPEDIQGDDTEALPELAQVIGGCQ